MSTITTTPAPQINRTPLLVGIAVVGVLAVSTVAIPRIASTVGSSAATDTSSSNAVITPHDLVEHRADVGSSLDNARISSAIERQLTHTGKVLASTSVGLATTAVVPPSTLASQVGGLQQTYAYRPATLAALGLTSTLRQQVGGLAPTFQYAPAASPRMVYNGRELVAVAAAPAVAASTLRQQVGGEAPTYAYTPATGPTQVYNGRGLVQVAPAGTHTRWTDTFVPPYDDPEWMPVITRHYAGSFTTPTTHEFR